MKWSTVIFIGILFIILVFVQRKFFPEQIITTTHDTIYSVHDSIQYISKPVPYEVQLPPDTAFIPIDSVKLVERYLAIHKELYTKRYYKETYKIDTIGTASIKGRVFMNKLDSLEFTYNLKTPTIINTTIVANVKNSLYLGALFGKQSVTPIVMWDNKNKYQYFVSYNLLRSEVNVGVAININKIKLW